MTLELVRLPPAAPEKPVKLLFIHGICTGAWVWRQSFLPYFASLGYDVSALSLRGHGESDGRERVRSFGLRDFANDVEWAVKEIGGPVVIVGHSLGGGVVQNYVKRGGRAAGVVLMCAAPPHGLMRSSAELFIRNPTLFRELQRVLERGIRNANLDIIEDGLFAEPPSPQLRRLFFERMDDIAESASRQLYGFTPFAPLPWGMPKLMVIGCEKDEFVPPADVRLTAIYYGARSIIVKGGGHAIMMDSNWKDAAEPIAGWLAQEFRGAPGGAA
jgi:pimeloyl-ACP methyl ester carboxylesterase